MSCLLDTNVVSENVKKRKNAAFLDRLASTDASDHHISAVTIGELRRGVRLLSLRRDIIQAGRLEAWLDALIAGYTGRIVPVSSDIAQRRGHRDADRPTPIVDGLIGATAEVKGWTLVTRNVRYLPALGVEVLNPFSEEDG